MQWWFDDSNQRGVAFIVCRTLWKATPCRFRISSVFPASNVADGAEERKEFLARFFGAMSAMLLSGWRIVVVAIREILFVLFVKKIQFPLYVNINKASQLKETDSVYFEKGPKIQPKVRSIKYALKGESFS